MNVRPRHLPAAARSARLASWRFPPGLGLGGRGYRRGAGPVRVRLHVGLHEPALELDIGVDVELGCLAVAYTFGWLPSPPPTVANLPPFATTYFFLTCWPSPSLLAQRMGESACQRPGITMSQMKRFKLSDQHS